MNWLKIRSLRFWLAVALIVGIGLLLIFSIQPTPDNSPPADSSPASDPDDQGQIVSVPTPPDQTPVGEPETDEHVVQEEVLVDLQVDCQEVLAINELPVIELNELLTEVYECQYKDQTYRRYLKTEFITVWLQTLRYTSAIESDVKLENLCQQSDFQQLVADSEASLLITDFYVFQTTDPADKAALQAALAADFNFQSSLDICQRLSTGL